MRKIIACLFLTMDGVIQSPGGPDEDPKNNFKWGGWSFPHWDDIMNQSMAKITAEPYDLLLGRRTYEIFAAFWPNQQNDPTSEMFNRVEKYVVATTKVDTSWINTSLITGNVIHELEKFKASDGPNLLIYGSADLCQTLFKHHLIDVLHTWTFPVTLGSGQRLFEKGTQPEQWKLADAVVSSTGVIMASYSPDGDVKTGSMSDG
nr:dihydrofolate reductase family protein [uncultured Pedobacter sp.]